MGLAERLYGQGALAPPCDDAGIGRYRTKVPLVGQWQQRTLPTPAGAPAARGRSAGSSAGSRTPRQRGSPQACSHSSASATGTQVMDKGQIDERAQAVIMAQGPPRIAVHLCTSAAQQPQRASPTAPSQHLPPARTQSAAQSSAGRRRQSRSRDPALRMCGPRAGAGVWAVWLVPGIAAARGLHAQQAAHSPPMAYSPLSSWPCGTHTSWPGLSSSTRPLLLLYLPHSCNQSVQPG